MTPVEERIDHAVTKRIAESFADGFMHPNLERDATRLARAYLALLTELPATEPAQPEEERRD